MGRKLPLDLGQQLARREGTPQHEGFFTETNPYGYKINISHPQIRPLYDRYLRKLSTPIMSDGQRHQFEALIMHLIATGHLRER